MGLRAAQSTDERGTFVREELVKMCTLKCISTNEAKLFRDLGLSFLYCVCMHLIIIISSLANFTRYILCMENLITSMPCRCAHLSGICISRFRCT